jgi:hypothetical protein
MKKVLIVLLTALALSSPALADEQEEAINRMDKGEKCWANDECIKNSVSAPKKSLYLLSSCRAIEAPATVRFGKLQTSVSDAKLGKSYSYPNFCMAWNFVVERLGSIDNYRKLWLVLGEPAWQPGGTGVAGQPQLEPVWSAAWMVQNLDGSPLSEVLLLDINKNFWGEAKRGPTYKKFYSTLFTSDGEAALKAVYSIPQAMVNRSLEATGRELSEDQVAMEKAETKPKPTKTSKRSNRK